MHLVRFPSCALQFRTKTVSYIIKLNVKILNSTLIAQEIALKYAKLIIVQENL